MMAMLHQPDVGTFDLPKIVEANKTRIEAMVEAKSGPSRDVSGAYQKAVERALEIMTKLSEAAREANNQANSSIKTKVDTAIKDMKN